MVWGEIEDDDILDVVFLKDYMNRRGFVKLLALTPLVGLLKPARTFRGQVTDVHFYSKALTDKEMNELYNTIKDY